MKPGYETPDIIEECRKADTKIEEYNKAHGLAMPYAAPWPGAAISCGRSPLPLVLASLIEDNRKMREELDEMKKGTR